MKDSEISFDMEFNNHDKTIQFAFFQLEKCGESTLGGVDVLSMKLSFVFALMLSTQIYSKTSKCFLLAVPTPRPFLVDRNYEDR